jgi:hypothetical protein
VTVPSSIARLPDVPPPEELQWHCFDNKKIPDDSGCATTKAGCKKIARIRQASYEKFNVPFEASECDIPIKSPYCYYYQDSDERYLRYDCCKSESCCQKSHSTTKFEVISECKESPPINRPKSYKLGD